MEEKRNTYRIFVRKPEEEQPIGRPRLRGNCNVKINLKKQDEKTWHCIDLACESDNWRAKLTQY